MSLQIPNFENYKSRIECLSANYQIEILNILVKNGVKINENKTGIRLNMGILWKDHQPVWEKMVEYLLYVEEQETQLETVESEKQEMTSFYFH